MKFFLALLFISFSCLAQYDETDALFSAEDYALEHSHKEVRVKPHKEEKKVIVVTQEELDRVLKSTKEGSK